MTGEVLNVIVSHQSADKVERLLAWWRRLIPSASILLLHSGSEREFERVSHPWKIRLDDPRLATSDHQRERQSYTGLIREASRFLLDHDFRYIYLSEYDHLPLVPDLNEKQIERLAAEKADFLAFRLLRVDGTSHPHFLYHRYDSRFPDFWRTLTVRDEPGVVLSMFGTGSFWTREAFLAVAEREEPFPIYLEIYLPTLAHHLGFRARGYGEQDQFVHNLGERSHLIADARRRGAWTLHPVKELGAAEKSL